MAPITTGGSTTRATRATTSGAPTIKAKDEPNRTQEPTVRDAATAIEYLIDGDFKSEDEEMSFECLSAIAMQLSQQPRPPKQAAEAFKALSYLIADQHKKNMVGAVADVIAKAVSVATKRVREELVEATEQIVSAAASMTNTVEELKGECRTVVAELKETVEDAATSLLQVDSNNQNTKREAQSGGGKKLKGSLRSREEGGHMRIG